MVKITQVVKVRGINYVLLLKRSRWSKHTLELETDSGEEIIIELSQNNMEEIYKNLAGKLGKKVAEKLEKQVEEV
jgi:hypothetical protein